MPTYSYTFTDPNGHTDSFTVTTSGTLSTVNGGTVTGQGYAVTGISGKINGKSITGEVGSPASVQTDTTTKGSAIYDNTLFPSAGNGGTYNGGSGSSYGLDVYGLEFTVGSTHYNLYEKNGQFELLNVSTNKTQALTLVSTNAPCFCAGTSIATPGGARAVEELAAGDIVLTPAGEAKTVRWIGRRVVNMRFADPVRNLPVRIKAGALGSGLPRRDLLLSPDHAMFLGGILVQAGAMVNGTSIVREGNMPAHFTYYHIETAEHSLILAEGAPAETFVDNADRMAFDNWPEYEALLDNAGPVAEMTYPRAKSARQIPAPLRAKLNACATAYAKPEAA